MRLILYTLCLLIFPSIANGQAFFEQIAFDYFKDVIANSSYSNRSIFLVEPKLVKYNPMNYPKCQQNDVFRKDWKDLVSKDSVGMSITNLNKNYKPLQPFIDNNKSIKPNFRTKAGKGNRVRKVQISESVVLREDFFIVTVMVYIPQGRDNYFIEVSEDGEVTKWCKGGFVY
ncbi:hypothetical protein WG947_02615 [Pontibacter sp. H259]|uniref:hypothetical protein n=1 Tax=Pontibacter sp. H259 TaxID=3133421 RepID=UPI0030BF59BA